MYEQIYSIYIFADLKSASQITLNFMRNIWASSMPRAHM